MAVEFCPVDVDLCDTSDTDPAWLHPIMSFPQGWTSAKQKIKIRVEEEGIVFPQSWTFTKKGDERKLKEQNIKVERNQNEISKKMKNTMAGIASEE